MLCLALTLYGSLIDLGKTANFLPFNVADNWLHLGLGTGMIALGVALGAATARTRATPVLAESGSTTSRPSSTAAVASASSAVDSDATKAELYEKARELGIDGRSTMDKATVLRRIRRSRTARR